MFDEAEIRRTLGLFLAPGDVTEMRVIGSPRGTISGYYNDAEALCRDAVLHSGKAPAVYFCPNPIRTDLLARACNRFDKARATTADADILRRLWLLVDLDPVRPADVSATDNELKAALERAETLREWTTEFGWPAPVRAMSGNGAHLVWHVEEPNDAATAELFSRILGALHLRFSDASVGVDRKTFNAARIWKLYGTLAAKGDDVEALGRRHRLAHLIEVPSAVVLTRELLEAVAATAAEIPKPEKQRAVYASGSGDYASLDVVAWFRSHGAYGRSLGDGKHAVDCPWRSEHSTQREAEESDTVIWEASGTGWPTFHCAHDHCEGRDLQAVLSVWADVADFCSRPWSASWPTGHGNGMDVRLADVVTMSEQLAATIPGSNFLSIQPLRKIMSDPPAFFAAVNGLELELTEAQLTDWRLFKRLCITRLMFIPVLPSVGGPNSKLLPQTIWEQYVLGPAVRHAIVEDAPPDAGLRGAVWESIRACLRKAKIWDTLEDAAEFRVALVDGSYYFRGEVLRHWFRVNFGRVEDSLLWAVVRAHGGASPTPRTRKGKVRMWMLPAVSLLDSEEPETAESDAERVLLN